MAILGNEAIAIIKEEMALYYKMSKVERTNLVNRLAHQFGVSDKHIMRISKDTRYHAANKTRKKRATEADKKGIAPDYVLYWIADQIRQKSLKNQGIGVQEAVDLAIDNNIFPKDATGKPIVPSVPWLRARLRQINAGAMQIKNLKKNKPRMRFEADFPNEIWQFDTTVSQQFYINEKNNIIKLPTDAYKNKPLEPDKGRMVLYLAIDMDSRAKFARFYINDNKVNTMDFLIWCFLAKKDPQGKPAGRIFPAHGLPQFILSDGGAPLHSKYIKDQLKDRLGIEVEKHAPGDPNVKGQVERAFQVLQKFEYMISLVGKKQFKDLDEANLYLWNYLLTINNTAHSYTKEKPFERWERITDTQLRNAPDEEIINALRYQKDTRCPNNYREFTIDGHFYALPNQRPFVDYIGPDHQGNSHYIEVYYIPGRFHEIQIKLPGREDKVFTIKEGRAKTMHPHEPRKNAQTSTERTLAKIDKLKEQGVILPLRKPGPEVFTNSRLGGVIPEFEERTGQKFDNSRIDPGFKVSTRTYSYWQAYDELRNRRLISFKRPTDAELAQLNNTFNNNQSLEIDEHVFAELVKSYQNTPSQMSIGVVK